MARDQGSAYTGRQAKCTTWLAVAAVVTVGVAIGGIIAVAPLTATPQPEGAFGIESTGGPPVVLLEGDLNREINHLGLEPTELLRASGWRGLYGTSKGYEVRDVHVEVSIRFSPDGDTLFTVTVDPTDLILLIAGIPTIRSGPVKYSMVYHRSLSVAGVGASQEEVELALGTKVYHLRVSAFHEQLCDAVVTLHHRDRVRELYTGEKEGICDEPHFRLKWAGDLDGDGRLDLLATFSPKYSVHSRQLYLSSLSDDGLAVLAATYNPY